MIPINSWNCESCKGYNDVLNNHCSFCKTYKPNWLTTEYQLRVEIRRGIFDSYGVLSAFHYNREGRVKFNQMTTPNEELFAKFFNEETLLVQGMNDIDLDEHIHQLEEIAREAKARILAGTQQKRERAAKSGNKKWRVEPLGPDPNVTDSLNKVKQRSARMSKLEKMRESMASLGIPDSEVEQMIAKMVAKARKEPEALKEEARLKKELNEPPLPPTIITEEHRLAALDEKKRLDDIDKAEEKAAKKAELAAVHNDKDEKLILTIDKPAEQSEAEVQAKKEAARLAAFNLFGPNIAKQ